MYRKNTNNSQQKLNLIYSSTPEKNLLHQDPAVAQFFDRLVSDYYQSIKYVRQHNKPTNNEVE